MNRLAVIIASGFGTGFLPKAPGSWGSAAILPVALMFHFLFGDTALVFLSALLFVIGLAASKKYIALKGQADPPEITIDEMAAQMLVLAAVQPTLIHYFVAFLLFRLFDIVKPWPIPLIERGLSPALAVMADDMAAAAYAIIVLTLLRFFGAL